MSSFKDNQGRSWQIAVTINTVKRVRSLLDIDLLAIVDGKLLERLVNDPVLLVDVLYAVVKPYADEEGISDADFGDALAGDAIDAATTALLEGLADFFPQRRRELLHRALGKLREVEARAMDLAEEKLADPSLDLEIQRILGDSSTASPASSAATPAP